MQHYPLTFGMGCGIIMVSRGEDSEVEGWVPSRGVQIPSLTSEKKLKFPLDKPHKMCYNKGVKRGTSAAKASRTVENRNRSGLVINIHEIYLFRRSRSGAVRLMAETRMKQVSDLRVTEIMKKVRNFFRKPLDKQYKVCYNLNVIKGRKTLKPERN